MSTPTGENADNMFRTIIWHFPSSNSIFRSSQSSLPWRSLVEKNVASVRAITARLIHLLPFHTRDLVNTNKFFFIYLQTVISPGLWTIKIESNVWNVRVVFTLYDLCVLGNSKLQLIDQLGSANKCNTTAAAKTTGGCGGQGDRWQVIPTLPLSLVLSSFLSVLHTHTEAVLLG